jgi:phosphonate transport system ATP-binding protein
LGDVCLRVFDGERVAVIGPSGAGRTTLLRVAAASLKPSMGRLAFDGVDPWSLSVRALQRQRGRLFMAPQTPPLPPRQRVVTAVRAGCLPAWSLATSLRSLFYPYDIPGAYAALERFDLGDKLFARVDRLSGGERQRPPPAHARFNPADLRRRALSGGSGQAAAARCMMRRCCLSSTSSRSASAPPARTRWGRCGRR